MTSLQNKLNKIPEINFNSNHWYELIDLTAPDITEPPTTQHFSNQETFNTSIVNSVKTYCRLPFSLSVELTVKLVSGASHHVYRFEN